MAIKNYTTTISVEKSARDVQMLLLKHHALRISQDYDKERVIGITFDVKTEFGLRSFALPVRTDGVLAALKADRSLKPSQRTREQAERVAWRIAKDWLEVQFAFVDSGVAKFDEVMMPYMLDGNSNTMFDLYRGSQLELEAKS